MDRLKTLSRQRIEQTDFEFKRYLFSLIDWSNRLIAVKGARGVGKTTLILQYLREHFRNDETALYISLDDIYFSANSLSDLADTFYKGGGKILFLDEVHKYRGWSREIKNIYDSYSALKIVFTSSSILQIHKGFADLSRRVVTYDLLGLSFREFLEINGAMKHVPLTLQEIIDLHKEIENDIARQIRPLEHFRNYLRYGYYPFFLENIDSYLNKLLSAINLTLEYDLPSAQTIEFSNIFKLKKLLYFIATSAPYKPNISKLAEQIQASRSTIILYLDHLWNGKILNLINSVSGGTGYLTKPEKIYLQNTNLMYALAPETVDKGNLRETFFLNQVGHNHVVTLSDKADFLVNDKFTFEIGGKNKSRKQILDIQNSYIASDDIEYGFGNKIPLWLFGFLY